MLELIAIVAGLVVCVMMPIEVGKIRKGWVHKKFAGDRPRFLVHYRKQARVLMWLGLFFGVSGVGLAALEGQSGEAIVRLIGVAVWFAVSGIAFTSLRTLAQIPDTEFGRELRRLMTAAEGRGLFGSLIFRVRRREPRP